MTRSTAAEPFEHPCSNHPGTLTAVSCGKCGVYICPRCMVFTQVGIRCRGCARLRPAAQFDVGADRLALAGLIGLGVSVVAWAIALEAAFLIWLLAVFVGLAVGEAASRMARRRHNRWLEIVVGADIVVGFFVTSTALSSFGSYLYGPGLSFGAVRAGALTYPLIALAIAVVFGVTRLRG